jgi:hypothetical protein
VYLRELDWNICLLDKASADTVTDRGNQLLLCWFLSCIDTEDILAFGLGFVDLFYHAG